MGLTFNSVLKSFRKVMHWCPSLLINTKVWRNYDNLEKGTGKQIVVYSDDDTSGTKKKRYLCEFHIFMVACLCAFYKNSDTTYPMVSLI